MFSNVYLFLPIVVSFVLLILSKQFFVLHYFIMFSLFFLLHPLPSRNLLCSSFSNFFTPFLLFYNLSMPLFLYYTFLKSLISWKNSNSNRRFSRNFFYLKQLLSFFIIPDKLFQFFWIYLLLSNVVVQALIKIIFALLRLLFYFFFALCIIIYIICIFLEILSKNWMFKLFENPFLFVPDYPLLLLS